MESVDTWDFGEIITPKVVSGEIDLPKKLVPRPLIKDPIIRFSFNKPCCRNFNRKVTYHQWLIESTF